MQIQTRACVRHLGNSSKARASHALFGVALVCLEVACSRDARAVRLQAMQPGDEIYRITCGAEIGVCRDEALEVCKGSYQVLETAGAPIEPQRVTSAPGPISTGPRYQKSKWLGRMVVACGDTAPAVSAALPTQEPRPAAAQALRAPQLGRDQLCIPGATQECLGPAACRGAQACLMDGRGYGTCDCGSDDADENHHQPERDAGGAHRDLR